MKPQIGDVIAAKRVCDKAQITGRVVDASSVGCEIAIQISGTCTIVGVYGSEVVAIIDKVPRKWNPIATAPKDGRLFLARVVRPNSTTVYEILRWSDYWDLYVGQLDTIQRMGTDPDAEWTEIPE